MSTYGTDKSELLQEVIKVGFKPIAITVMICEETFVFETEEEAHRAAAIFMPEGWWYGLDGKYPWEQTLKDYVNGFYDGDQTKSPVVYKLTY